MHFRRAAHPGDPAQVRDERHALRTAPALAAEAARHQGPEPVRADGEPRSDRRVLATGPAHQRAGHRAGVVEQGFDAGAFVYLGACLAGGSHQSGVEDPARQREPGGTERPESGFAEESGEAAAACADDRGAFDRHGPRGLQVADDAEAVEEPDRLGTHVFRAGFVPGKGGPVHHDDPPAGAGQVHGGRAAGRAGPRNQDVSVHAPQTRS